MKNEIDMGVFFLYKYITHVAKLSSFKNQANDVDSG